MAYRRVGEGPGAPIEIVLVTSRQTRRWIIPKGNVDYGMSPYAAAAMEAEEEAGVRGEIGHDPLGSFTYEKRIVSGICVTAKVVVFPLAVREVMDEWKESSWRRRKWCGVEEVADAIQDVALAFREQAIDISGTHRPRKKESLHRGAALRPQLAQLILLLDPLGGGFHAEGGGELGDRPDHRHRARAPQQVLDEAAVDLQSCRMEALQIAQ